MITECLLREITIEYLSARGERPYRILRGGSSLWETHVPAMRLALVSALQSVEGGVRVAAKQESCPESAPRRCWNLPPRSTSPREHPPRQFGIYDGRGGMSYHLFSATWQPARKSHSCIWCGERIRQLEIYLREKSVYDGNHQNHAWHWDCWFWAKVEYFNHGEEDFSPYSNERPQMRPFRCMEAA